jgi:DNA-binding protein Alba
MVVITSFTGTNTKDATLKRWGRAIATAVDVAEITRRRFMKELDVRKMTIGAKDTPQEEGGTRNASTIEITLKRRWKQD